jgi:hypothetical protein
MPGSRSFFSRILGPNHAGRDYPLAENYVLLRDMVFGAKPDSIGLHQTPAPGRVWGVVMETGYEEAVATLVALADGTVSLYFSNGGGIIGLGAHEEIQRASQALLEFAPGFAKYCQPATKNPLPRREHTSFYLLLHNAILTADAREADLGNDRHDLSPLFHRAHKLITEIRLADEKRQAGEAATTEPPGALEE